jgi:hypothetical protein
MDVGLTEGWGKLTPRRGPFKVAKMKYHYFNGVKSLCGKVVCFGDLSEESPAEIDACTECWKRHLSRVANRAAK